MKYLWLIKKWLIVEITGWVGDGIITPVQRELILERYGLDDEAMQSRKSHHGTILLTLAALFTGVALLLIIGENWERMGRWVKFALVLAGVIAAHGGGLYFHLRGRGGYARALFFLGSMFYGGGIWLTAQIFHIDAHYPNGVLAWCLGVLPIGLTGGGAAVVLLSSLLAFLWFVMEASMERIVFLYVPLGVLYLVYSYRSKERPILVFLSSLIGLVTWLEVWMKIRLDVPPEALFAPLVFYGLTAVAAGYYHRDVLGNARFGAVLYLWGGRLFLLMSFLFSFRGILEEFFEEIVEPGALIGYLVIPLVCYVLLWIFLSLGGERRIGFRKHPGLLIAGMFFLILYLGMYYGGGQSDDLIVMAVVVMNIFCLGCGVYMINKGILRDDGLNFFGGVCFLLLLAMVRYFDLLGGYLGGSLSFLVAAGILYLSGRFWSARHRQEDGVRKKEGTPQEDGVRKKVGVPEKVGAE